MISSVGKHRIMPVIKRLSLYLSPSLTAAICVFAITAAALFIRPYIDMADNGDFFRIAYSSGLYFNTPDYDSQYLGYFIKNYGILQYFNENGTVLTSSQSLFIRMAIGLNTLFYDYKTFDIRFQAFIYLLLLTVAVYLLVESLTWKSPRKYGYPIALLAVFMFADSGYTAYFNSFYSESIVYIALLMLTAASLLLYRRRYNDYALLALFGISGLLLTTSKQQNAPIGIIIALFGLMLLLVRRQGTYRLFTSFILAALFTAGLATYAFIPKEFVNINKYHAMTRGVLMDSPNPEQTLEGFDIDKQYAILSGSIYYEPYTTVDVNSDLLQNRFYSHYGFGSILAYYFTHPEQTRSMLDLAARNAFTIRPPAMGNYEREAGKPFGAQTSFFSVYSDVKAALAPKTFGFIVLWLLIVVGFYVPSFASAIRNRSMRKAIRFPLILMISMVGLSGIAVSLIGAGDADLAKHQFTFTAVFDLVTCITISDLIRRQFWQEEPMEGAGT